MPTTPSTSREAVLLAAVRQAIADHDETVRVLRRAIEQGYDMLVVILSHRLSLTRTLAALEGTEPVHAEVNSEAEEAAD